MSLTDTALEARLRRDLPVVASRVTGDPVARVPRASRRRWFFLGVGVIVVPILAGAAAFVRSGPEYVDTIPKDSIIVTGDIDGSRYLLVESRRTRCGVPVTGVELVEEDENLLGSEWNTVGEEYGERGGCGIDTSAWLLDPAKYSDSGTEVGNSFVWLWAVHPDVSAVRITAGDASEDLPVYRVDGAGYAVYEVPLGREGYTSELMIGETPVPGTREEHLGAEGLLRR